MLDALNICGSSNCGLFCHTNHNILLSAMSTLSGLSVQSHELSLDDSKCLLCFHISDHNHSNDDEYFGNEIEGHFCPLQYMCIDYTGFFSQIGPLNVMDVFV